MLSHNVYDLLYISFTTFRIFEYEFDIRISTETKEYSNYSNMVQPLIIAHINKNKMQYFL